MNKPTDMVHLASGESMTRAEFDAICELRAINNAALDAILEQAFTRINEVFNADIHGKHFLRKAVKREIVDSLRKGHLNTKPIQI